MKAIDLIECPRDAIQGLEKIITTDRKAAYIQGLIDSGFFHTIDFGSFVSHRAIPQMADTAQVVQQLNCEKSNTKLLAIVVNEQGALAASEYTKIHYQGFPFSVSETFQLRNTKADRNQAFERLLRIKEISETAGQQLVTYISMAFGNPYADYWSADLVLEWVDKIAGARVKIISLADTTGIAKTSDISILFKALINQFPDITFGAHFHTNSLDWEAKINAAYDAGCRRFDGAILGFGGCPMAEDELVGNMSTENLLVFKEETDLVKIEKLKESFRQLVL